MTGKHRDIDYESLTKPRDRSVIISAMSSLVKALVFKVIVVLILFLTYFSLNATPEQNISRRLQHIEECSCRRRFFYQIPLRPTVLASTCSDEGSIYVRSQNTVSFVLYFAPEHEARAQKLYDATEDKDFQLREGLRRNIKWVQEFYPGYSMRVYTNEPIENYCDSVCNNENVFWCDISKVAGSRNLSMMFFPTWKFLPLGDPTVNVFLSRDLDSEITTREVAIVEDWLKNSDKGIYAVKDLKFWNKEAYQPTPILGGIWGASNQKLGWKTANQLQEAIIIEATVSEKMTYGYDQIILKDVVYEQQKQDIVVYDSYDCVQQMKETEVRPIPVKRLPGSKDVVANYWVEDKNTFNITPCPIECRPSYGKNWTFC